MQETVPSAKPSQRALSSGTMARGFAPITAWWRRLMRRFANGYQPERHYMRGPGPKWHKRNSR